MKLIATANVNQIKTLNDEDIFANIKKEVEAIASAPRYNFVVTEENMGSVKTIRAELNKFADSIDTIRKDKVKAESTDIQLFETNFKALVITLKDKYTELSEGLVFFEKRAKEAHKVKLLEYLEELFVKNDIREEFQFKGVDGYLSTTGLTKETKVLVKGSKDKIDAYVEKLLGSQNKFDLAEVKRKAEEAERTALALAKQKEQLHLEELDRAKQPAPVVAPIAVPSVLEQIPATVPTQEEEHPFGSSGTTPYVPENVPEIDDGMAVFGVQITYNVSAPFGFDPAKIKGKILVKLLGAGFSNSAGADLQISVVEM